MGTSSRSITRLAIVPVMALSVLLPLSASAAVPDWVESPDKSGYPLWVSAETAVQDGRLRPELFPEATHQYLMKPMANIQKYRARTGDTGTQTESGNTCVFSSVVVSKPPLDKGVTIRDLFERAESMFTFNTPESWWMESFFVQNRPDITFCLW